MTASGHVDQSVLGPFVFSQTLFHLCYCVLYHPFLLKNKLKDFHGQRPSNFLSRGFETAYTHAKQLVSQIDAAKAARCSVHIAFYSYASALAGSILALYALDTSETLRFEADSLQQRNISFLEELGQRWNHTPKALWLLQKLIVDSQSFSAFVFDAEEQAKLPPSDEELMWTLLDYSAWPKMLPDDNKPTFYQEQSGNDWPNLNMSLDDFCTPFPHFDLDGYPGSSCPLPLQLSKSGHYTYAQVPCAEVGIGVGVIQDCW